MTAAKPFEGNRVHVSILHISDLHRDPENPIRNDVLLTSLESDCRHYTTLESTHIRSPDLIIATGDIIQGVPAESTNAEDRLRRQYDEALDFLGAMTDRFVGGDRERVIVVPGNHDVSAYHFIKALKKIDIPDDRKRTLVRELFGSGSRLRWSWERLELHEIVDESLYDKRLAEFAAFYERFYKGERKYSTRTDSQFDLFEQPAYNLTIAGFSSCFNNDLWNRRASINPSCIAQATTSLRRPNFANRIRIAAWHHSTEPTLGGTDYLDPGVLQNLIDGGFSMGFHGHQHRPQFLDTRFKYGASRAIKVISAGTLCGGASFRYGRSYNLIELDVHENRGRLHVREMQNDDLANPIWGVRKPTTGELPYYEFDFERPEPRIHVNAETAALVSAQNALEAGRLLEARAALEAILASEELARPLLLECLVRLADFDGLVRAFYPPQNEAEAIHVMDALWRLRKRERLAEALVLPLIADATDRSVIEMREKFRAKLR